METAEKQTLFESSFEMQKETLSRIVETGKKVTEMYQNNNPFKFIVDSSTITSDSVSWTNSKQVKENIVKSAKIFSKQVDTLSKFQRERVKLFTKTQSEWLQNSESNVTRQWIEKWIEMNDFMEKAYVEFDTSMQTAFQNGFDVLIQHLEENSYETEK